jgi:hypothetical protein
VREVQRPGSTRAPGGPACWGAARPGGCQGVLAPAPQGHTAPPQQPQNGGTMKRRSSPLHRRHTPSPLPTSPQPPAPAAALRPCGPPEQPVQLPRHRLHRQCRRGVEQRGVVAHQQPALGRRGGQHGRGRQPARAALRRPGRGGAVVAVHVAAEERHRRHLLVRWRLEHICPAGAARGVPRHAPDAGLCGTCQAGRCAPARAPPLGPSPTPWAGGLAGGLAGRQAGGRPPGPPGLHLMVCMGVGAAAGVPGGPPPSLPLAGSSGSGSPRSVSQNSSSTDSSTSPGARSAAPLDE